ncbi:hypothetical protein CDEST_02132 [Colletotrichum destructivum]|uniref:Uncharacterized protein n=1 Tax=Colletotrichum destructivum TaxID=34406 RepID=A0AAX4I190_9PEZI|nr:hypothetical protein CDEST_02132 [Colletotrichum destructivum]
MESLNFDWPDSNFAIHYGTPQYLTSDSTRVSPAAERASLVAEQANDQSNDERALPLLRLSDWERTTQYDKNNPICIHYDFRWKVSQREKIRARQVCSDTDPDLVLAPSDFWNVDFEPRLEALLKDKNKFPGDKYTCEETIIDISVERSRQRGLKKRFEGLEIDWDTVNNHMEGLGPLFSKGRKLTFSLELFYKEASGDSTTTKGKRKKPNATEAQKLQRAADAGLWTRVYEHHRCRGRHCKQGPHCWPDERGNHHKLLSRHLEEIVRHIKGNMREGENEEEVDVGIEIPSTILRDVLDDSRKRKAESSIDCRSCKAHASAHGRHRNAAEATLTEDLGPVEGDRSDILEEYCNWTLQQVKSDRWRGALQTANQFALDQFLELNSILQHPKVAAELMVKGGVKPGIALQFVSNIKKFQQEAKRR